LWGVCNKFPEERVQGRKQNEHQYQKMWQHWQQHQFVPTPATPQQKDAVSNRTLDKEMNAVKAYYSILKNIKSSLSFLVMHIMQ